MKMTNTPLKSIAILQPNYIPWKGVFDLINSVDCFVFYDDVQFTVRDWRNRNKVKTPQGPIWLTVPVITKGKREQLIYETEIDTTQDWQKKHYTTIRNNYLKAKHFKKYEYLLDEIYLQQRWTNICELNIFATKLLASALKIQHVEWSRSSELKLNGDKHGEKAIKVCQTLACSHFINGPASKNFMNEDLFRQENIHLEYMQYDYPEYFQLHGDFVHEVSVLDTIFNCGEQAMDYIFQFRSQIRGQRNEVAETRSHF